MLEKSCYKKGAFFFRQNDHTEKNVDKDIFFCEKCELSMDDSVKRYYFIFLVERSKIYLKGSNTYIHTERQTQRNILTISILQQNQHHIEYRLLVSYRK